MRATIAPLTWQDARIQASQFAAAAREHFGARVRQLVLFGSAARGDWSPESDVDVLVLLDRLTSADEEWLTRAAVQLGVLHNGLLLQPLFMTTSQFQELRQRERRLALTIDREGIPL